MEDLSMLDPAISCSDEITGAGSFTPWTEFHGQIDNLLQFDTSEAEICESEMSDLIKDQIVNHPSYQSLVYAYVDCRKIGAPPELASDLEKLWRESHPTGGCCQIGIYPELDEFMDSYCEILHRYKEELSKPFDEATTFLSNMKTQLSNLCEGTSMTTTTTGNYHWDEAAGTLEEELSCEEVEASKCQEAGPVPSDLQELKEMIQCKYSGQCLSRLRKKLLKKRKGGKLPKDARMRLLDWWNTHYRWPYPTEEEKVKLSEDTALDQKQVSNWFINQRKRHWKASEGMRFALSGSGVGPPMYVDTRGGTGS
ncbi:hypothetical protein HHK36_022998 [Tetracentron sinense]|uniref:Homeobox domain-containing protein n=1 Tax=Tetracentron sinense TaxID=13715 RepID=A0A834YNU2_TETSI|nr:hypothetical protein HHK36_022998 [Tetracentron sinense]